MPKKSTEKIPYHGGEITIYGIFHLPTSKLIKVDLNQEEIFFEYDMNMYDSKEYCIVKLQVSL